MKQLKRLCSWVVISTMIIGMLPMMQFTTVSAASAAIGRHEAENADSFTKGSSEVEPTPVSDANFSGGVAMEGMNTWPDDGRAYCTTTVTATESGTYEMTIGYAGGEANHPCNIDVRINDGEWISTVAQPTAGWNTVETVSLTIELTEGDNIIDVTGACNIWYADMGWEWIMLDYFELEKVANENSISKTAKELKENSLVNFRGRTTVVGDAIGFDYTNSGFEFNYSGSGTVKANITTTGTEKFAIDVDGTVTYQTVGSATTNITLAKNLEDGNHTIKVYKTQEATSGLAQLNSLSYDENAVLSPVSYDLKFEFVGDSITCGNQIDPVTGAENGYLSYGSILARSYNADWNTVSVSGRGLIQGYNSESGWAGSNQAQLKDLFGYVSYFRDNTTTYDYSYQPDVLIMGVGSNDLGSDIMTTIGTTIDDFTAEVTAFHNKVRAQYPDTKIIWCYGTYYNRDYKDEYEAAVNALNDPNTAFVYFPQMISGNTGHPNYIQHERMAKILSAKIAEMLNVTNPMGEDIHIEAEIGTITGEGKVKEETEALSPYSGNTYVADLNAANNERFVTIPVNVAKAGNYRVAVSYGGSDGNPVINVKANEGAWKSYTATKGNEWFHVLTFDANLYLYEGENTISVTGDTNGNWANIDCIDLTYLGEGTPEEPTTPGDSENPSVNNPETTTPVVDANATRFEAENANSFTQGSAENEKNIDTSENFSNGQAVGGLNSWPEDGRAYCTTNVNLGEGIYKMTIAYAGGEADHPCNIDVRVNNSAWISTLAQPTAGWDTVETIELTITLKDGNNSIDVTGACNIWYEGMGWEWINLDYFELTRIGDVPETTTQAPTTVKSTTVAPTTAAPTTKVTKPGKATIKKATKTSKAAKKVKISLKKVKYAKGYQIQISTTKKFKKVLVKKTVKNINVTIKHKTLKGKKKLFVRARAYRLNGKKKVWGNWSKVKKVK